jgi:hypothetical protein
MWLKMNKIQRFAADLAKTMFLNASLFKGSNLKFNCIHDFFQHVEYAVKSDAARWRECQH